MIKKKRKLLGNNKVLHIQVKSRLNTVYTNQAPHINKEIMITKRDTKPNK